MCNDLDIEITQDDWIAYITDSSISVFWGRHSHHIIRNILFQVAKMLGYNNPRMMSTDDLRVSIPFLKGMSLQLCLQVFKLDRGGVRSIDYICDVYGVPGLALRNG